jgi:hypothetical protein
MKTTTRILPLAIALLSSLTLQAGDNHSHEKKVAGPNGGRILTTIEPHAEFFVTADRKVQITFVNDEGKAIGPAEQIVIVTTGERSAPVKMTFATSSFLIKASQQATTSRSSSKSRPPRMPKPLSKSSPSIFRIAQIASSPNTPASVTMPTEV